MRTPLSRLFSLLVLLLTASACGKKDESVAEVRGDITFYGQPAVAEILFEPLASSGKSAGRASTATSDESGKFRLMLDDSRTGAKIGRHRVSIRVQRLNAAIQTSGDFADGVVGAMKTTSLLREVHAGDNEFHFRLTF